MRTLTECQPSIFDFGILVKSRYTVVMMKNIFSDDHKALQALLRDLRNKAGLRQADVAERLGKAQSFVSKYESGERRLDVLELRAVCRVLDVSLTSFVQRLEEELHEA